MDINGYPWNGYPWISNGYPWISRDILRYPWISNGYQWISMEIYGYPWISPGSGELDKYADPTARVRVSVEGRNEP